MVVVVVVGSFYLLASRLPKDQTASKTDADNLTFSYRFYFECRRLGNSATRRAHEKYLSWCLSFSLVFRFFFLFVDLLLLYSVLYVQDGGDWWRPAFSSCQMLKPLLFDHLFVSFNTVRTVQTVQYVFYLFLAFDRDHRPSFNCERIVDFSSFNFSYSFFACLDWNPIAMLSIRKHKQHQQETLCFFFFVFWVVGCERSTDELADWRMSRLFDKRRQEFQRRKTAEWRVWFNVARIIGYRSPDFS